MARASCEGMPSEWRQPARLSIGQQAPIMAQISSCTESDFGSIGRLPDTFTKGGDDVNLIHCHLPLNHA
jgi:hypothetical protein